MDIYALVLDNDGSCLSGAVTAAGLALADAGIPMYDVIASVTLVSNRKTAIFLVDASSCSKPVDFQGIQNGATFVDPTVEEERSFLGGHAEDTGSVSLSFMATQGQVTEMTLTGALDAETALSAVDSLVTECTKISQLSRRCLADNVQRILTNV